MERIQSALDKARARRAEQSTLPPQRPSPSRSASGAEDTAPPPATDGTAALEIDRDAAPAAPEPQHGPDIAANWKALTEFYPRPGLMRRNRIVAFTGGSDAAHVDMMRTRILQQMRINGWRRLAVTSPGTGCGKTTTCLNLAFSLSRLNDQRTIVAEMDMRRPGLVPALGLKSPGNFAQVIEGTAAAADHLLRYGENVAFGANAAPARNPSELLQNAQVAPALTRLEAEYDPTVVIFDMPPMLIADDMLAFAPHVDCVLLLAAAEQSTVDEIDSCEKELAAHTNVLGVVLNKCRYVGKGYGYGYY